MAYCPHCNQRYDDTNETQPCCFRCGHPISCGCGGGHQYSPSSSSPSIPGDLLDGSRPDESDSDDDDSDEEAFSPGDELPF